MARLCGITLALCLIPAPAAIAQAQKASCLDAADEPHHTVILDRSDVRVLLLELPRLQSTKMHCHPSPMLYITTGPSAVTITAAGAIGIRQEKVAGQAQFVYAPATHSTRNESSGTYREVVIETRRPVHYSLLDGNYVGDEFAGDPIGPTGTLSFTRGALQASKTLLAPGASVPVGELSNLLIALTDLELDAGRSTITLNAQDVMLLPIGVEQLKNRGRLPARFIVVEF